MRTRAAEERHRRAHGEWQGAKPLVSRRRYPLFLQGKLFRGTFHFHDTHSLVEHRLEEVGALELPGEPL